MGIGLHKAPFPRTYHNANLSWPWTRAIRSYAQRSMASARVVVITFNTRTHDIVWQGRDAHYQHRPIIHIIILTSGTRALKTCWCAKNLRSAFGSANVPRNTALRTYRINVEFFRQSFGLIQHVHQYMRKCECRVRPQSLAWSVTTKTKRIDWYDRVGPVLQVRISCVRIEMPHNALHTGVNVSTRSISTTSVRPQTICVLPVSQS